MRDFCTDYAQALFSLAQEEGATKAYYEQLMTIGEAINENSDFVKLLDSPAVTKEERLNAVDEAFGDAERNIVNFIKILTEKRRAFCLGKCIDLFGQMYDEENNIERVECVTAVPLSPEQSSLLTQKLCAITGRDVVLTNNVSSDVMGGVLLRLKNSEINGSVALRLKELEKAITV